MIKRLVDFLCACSGARPDALLIAPTGRTYAATMGALLLLTSTVASLTSAYALHQAFLGDRFVDVVAVLGGLSWGTLVFCIDRLMILGIDKFASSRRLVAQVLTRLPLASIIALVMSKPLILKVTENVTDAELRVEQRETTQREVVANAQEEKLGERQQSVQELKGALRNQEARLGREPDSFLYGSTKDELAQREQQHSRVLAANSPRIARARREIEQIRTGSIAGEVSATEQARIELLQGQIHVFQREIAQEESAVAAAKEETAQAGRSWLQDETEKLTRTTGELEEAVRTERDATQRTGARNAEAETEIARIMAPNLINQYRVLRRITDDPRHADSASVRAFELGLDVFFLILELTPVLLKVLAKKGPLDHAAAALDFLDQERVNLDANTKATRRQMQAEAALVVHEQWWAAWQQAHLTKLHAGTPSIAELMRIRTEIKSAAA